MRLAAFIWALLYVTVSSGMVVTVSYCCNRLASISLIGEAYGCCGIDETKSCCDSDEVIIKAEIDSQLIPGAIQAVLVSIVSFEDLRIGTQAVFFELGIHNTQPVNRPPPIDRVINYCSLVYYG